MTFVFGGSYTLVSIIRCKSDGLTLLVKLLSRKGEKNASVSIMMEVVCRGQRWLLLLCPIDFRRFGRHTGSNKLENDDG